MSYGLAPSRADRCTYILYDKTSSKNSQYRYHGPRNTDKVSLQEVLDRLLDPVFQNNAQGRKVDGFVCLHVDRLVFGGNVFQGTDHGASS